MPDQPDQSKQEFPEVDRFINALKDKPEMRKELAQVSVDMDSILKFAKDKGYTFDHAEAKAYLSQKIGHDLSDKELKDLGAQGGASKAKGTTVMKDPGGTTTTMDGGLPFAVETV